jgi:hypothetical protein
MPWTTERWPPEAGESVDTDLAINEVREALEERDHLVQALFVPGEFGRWDPLRGTPKGRGAEPFPTVANFQHEVQKMLDLVWPLRWWDPNRECLYTLANLCQDAFGQDTWTYDLTAEDGEGLPANRWTPPYAAIFGELYGAINRLDRVQILPAISESRRRDSVSRLTFGIGNWADERAATFALFDGLDDGAAAGLAYDVGMGGEVLDDGTTQQWALDSREFNMTFATGALAGYTVRRAWLDFTTEAPEGSADFSDTFTAEVADGEGRPLGSFGSAAYGAKRIEVPAGSVHTGGDTTLAIRSTRADTADRPAWTPAGPNYTSSYREGLAVAGPVRLIVEVDFEYHA